MISPLEWFAQLAKSDGTPSERLSEFLDALVRQSNQSETISGSGSPEGVVTATPTKLYMDTAGATGSILYIKKTGTGNTGWVLV